MAGLVTAALLLKTTPVALAAVITLLLGQRAQAGIPAETCQCLLKWLLQLLALLLTWQFLAGATR